MLKKIQERIFPFIIALSALSVSASAAFYSVSGLSKLFAGAAFAVIVMAASLEVAKLVIASLLYQYRKSLPFLLKTYLSIACFVLILITSMGIYGFLSAAYQETSAKAGSIDSQIALIETKRDNIKEQLAVYNEEKSTINGAVADLRAGLSNNKIQYTNAEGVLITTTSRATRNSLEKQLDQAINRQDKINSKVDTLNQRLFDYETEIVEVSINNDIAGELGPLKYLSGLTGISMDKIINYLLLTIIFVFDPLAIALVIAANFAFAKLRPKTRENIYGEKVVVEKKDNNWDSTLNDELEEEDDGMWIEEEKEDFNGQFNADDLPPEDQNNDELKDLIQKSNIVKSPDVSSWKKKKVLNELEKKFDLNKDGILDTEENIRLNYYKRLQKLKDDNQKTY
tara:strand:- start:200 stop:1390 length:1191 start_codon:yes stop_codon:yes gene_type:complete